jgi:hypothetical protein
MGLLERGRSPNPTMQTLQSVARGLGLTIPDLLLLAQTEDSVEQLAADIRTTQHVPSLCLPTPTAARGNPQRQASGRAAESPGHRIGRGSGEGRRAATLGPTRSNSRRGLKA